MGRPYQVMVYGVTNEKLLIDLCESEEDMKHMTVLDMKKKICKKICKRTPLVKGTRLLFGNVPLDDESRTLSFYGIQHLANILCCIRLPGKQEKMYDLSDSSLTFVNGPDELDFEWNEYKSARAKMSCGHAVTPMSLTAWCHYLLSQGICKFTCPVERQDNKNKCDAEWLYAEVCHMALLTPEEKVEFEEKLARLAAGEYCDKQCPGCGSTVIRNDFSNLSVRCTMCTADRKRGFDFCWQCLKEWKGPMPRSDRCDNDGCVNLELEILRTCAEITFAKVSGVTGCPSLRACPTCGLRVEHSKIGCKNIICPRCKVKFCFVCLKGDCKTNFSACSSGVAPIQTSIPVCTVKSKEWTQGPFGSA